MMPSSTTNSSMKNTNDRKRHGMSLFNSKKRRHSELINPPKTERSASSSDARTKINYFTPEYSLAADKNFSSQFRQIRHSYQRNESEHGADEIQATSVSSYEIDEESARTNGNSSRIPSGLVSPIITSTDLNGSSTKLFKLAVPQATPIKMLSDGAGLSSALRIPTKIQLTKTLSTPNETNSQSTTTDLMGKEQTVEDYPLTPPPPILDLSQKGKSSKSIDSKDRIALKRHSLSFIDWSVPPTSELSPTSLTSSSPDDSFVELDLKINQISSSSIKRRYRSLSFSCPILPYSVEQSKPITPPYKSKSLSRISNGTYRKVRSTSPVIKCSSIERLKRRRRDQQIHGKKLKFKVKNGDEPSLFIRELLNELIEQIETIDEDKDKTSQVVLNTLIPIEESRSTVPELKPTSMSTTKFERNDCRTKGEEHVNETNHHEQKSTLRRSKTSIRDDTHALFSTADALSTDLKRQTSTPLSFHSIASSPSPADQQSPQSVSKTHIFTDIVNELIKGAKGLDKLSCPLVHFTNSIHNFIRLTLDKQNERVENLHHELEQKCSSQLTRANLFCTNKIQYFINKHSIISLNEHVNEITLIVKYFYFYVLSLNHRKRENEYELILTDLINGKYACVEEFFYSSMLTTIIEEFILASSLANDYLSAQPIVINQMEYSLPFIRNLEYEQELLHKNDTSQSINPFSNSNDLEDYLKCCEQLSTSIPHYPIQPSMYYLNYPPSGQYYYPSTDIHPYYYQSSYSNAPQTYGYNHPSAYYNHLTPFNEQYNYYYNQQTSYNIPLPNNNVGHQVYRRVNSNVQKKYSNPSLENPTATVFESSNVPSSQSKSTNPQYPS